MNYFCLPHFIEIFTAVSQELLFKLKMSYLAFIQLPPSLLPKQSSKLNAPRKASKIKRGQKWSSFLLGQEKLHRAPTLSGLGLLMDFRRGGSVLRNEEDRLSDCIMLNILLPGRERIPECWAFRWEMSPWPQRQSSLPPCQPAWASNLFQKEKEIFQKLSLWVPNPQPTIRRNSWNQRTAGMFWFKKANGNLLYDSGNSNGGSVTTQRDGWGGRWEGGSRGRGRMYIYGWFMLMYGRSQHNIVKQLSFN